MRGAADLFRRYEPVLLFSRDREGEPEEFFPLAAQDYVHDCRLRCKGEWQHPPGQALLKTLSTGAGLDRSSYLAYATDKLPEEQMALVDMGLELSRPPEPDLLPSDGYYQGAGWERKADAVVPRLVVSSDTADELESTWGEVDRQPLVSGSGSPASLVHLGDEEDPFAAWARPDRPLPPRAGPADQMEMVTLRGLTSLPRKIVQTARDKYKPHRDKPPVYHTHLCPIRRPDGRRFWAFEYWFLYAFNDWATHHGGNDHEGDWEMVCVFVDDQGRPFHVASSVHIVHPNTVRWGDLPRVDNWAGLAHVDRALWVAPQSGNVHPVIFVGCGSHANYMRRDIHDHVLGLYRDYARGDGSSIGPQDSGADKKWGEPVSLTGRPWNTAFRGKWGSIRFIPGTSGPASPARQRPKWNDPAQWANL